MDTVSSAANAASHVVDAQLRQLLHLVKNIKTAGTNQPHLFPAAWLAVEAADSLLHEAPHSFPQVAPAGSSLRRSLSGSLRQGYPSVGSLILDGPIIDTTTSSAPSSSSSGILDSLTTDMHVVLSLIRAVCLQPRCFADFLSDRRNDSSEGDPKLLYSGLRVIRTLLPMVTLLARAHRRTSPLRRLAWMLCYETLPLWPLWAPGSTFMVVDAPRKQHCVNRDLLPQVAAAVLWRLIQLPAAMMDPASLDGRPPSPMRRPGDGVDAASDGEPDSRQLDWQTWFIQLPAVFDAAGEWLTPRAVPSSIELVAFPYAAEIVGFCLLPAGAPRPPVSARHHDWSLGVLTIGNPLEWLQAVSGWVHIIRHLIPNRAGDAVPFGAPLLLGSDDTVLTMLPRRCVADGVARLVRRLAAIDAPYIAHRVADGGAACSDNETTALVDRIDFAQVHALAVLVGGWIAAQKRESRTCPSDSASLSHRSLEAELGHALGFALRDEGSGADSCQTNHRPSSNHVDWNATTLVGDWLRLHSRVALPSPSPEATEVIEDALAVGIRRLVTATMTRGVSTGGGGQPFGHVPHPSRATDVVHSILWAALWELRRHTLPPLSPSPARRVGTTPTAQRLLSYPLVAEGLCHILDGIMRPPAVSHVAAHEDPVCRGGAFPSAALACLLSVLSSSSSTEATAIQKRSCPPDDTSQDGDDAAFQLAFAMVHPAAPVSFGRNPTDDLSLLLLWTLTAKHRFDAAACALSIDAAACALSIDLGSTPFAPSSSEDRDRAIARLRTGFARSAIALGSQFMAPQGWVEVMTNDSVRRLNGFMTPGSNIRLNTVAARVGFSDAATVAASGVWLALVSFAQCGCGVDARLLQSLGRNIATVTESICHGDESTADGGCAALLARFAATRLLWDALVLHRRLLVTESMAVGGVVGSTVSAIPSPPLELGLVSATARCVDDLRRRCCDEAPRQASPPTATNEWNEILIEHISSVVRSALDIGAPPVHAAAAGASGENGLSAAVACILQRAVVVNSQSSDRSTSSRLSAAVHLLRLASIGCLAAVTRRLRAEEELSLAWVALLADSSQFVASTLAATAPLSSRRRDDALPSTGKRDRDAPWQAQGKEAAASTSTATAVDRNATDDRACCALENVSVFDAVLDYLLSFFQRYSRSVDRPESSRMATDASLVTSSPPPVQVKAGKGVARRGGSKSGRATSTPRKRPRAAVDVTTDDDDVVEIAAPPSSAAGAAVGGGGGAVPQLSTLHRGGGGEKPRGALVAANETSVVVAITAATAEQHASCFARVFDWICLNPGVHSPDVWSGKVQALIGLIVASAASHDGAISASNSLLLPSLKAVVSAMSRLLISLDTSAPLAAASSTLAAFMGDVFVMILTSSEALATGLLWPPELSGSHGNAAPTVPCRNNAQCLLIDDGGALWSSPRLSMSWRLGCVARVAASLLASAPPLSREYLAATVLRDAVVDKALAFYLDAGVDGATLEARTAAVGCLGNLALAATRHGGGMLAVKNGRGGATPSPLVHVILREAPAWMAVAVLEAARSPVDASGASSSPLVHVLEELSAGSSWSALVRSCLVPLAVFWVEQAFSSARILSASLQIRETPRRRPAIAGGAFLRLAVEQTGVPMARAVSMMFPSLIAHILVRSVLGGIATTPPMSPAAATAPPQPSKSGKHTAAAEAVSPPALLNSDHEWHEVAQAVRWLSADVFQLESAVSSGPTSTTSGAIGPAASTLLATLVDMQFNAVISEIILVFCDLVHVRSANLTGYYSSLSRNGIFADDVPLPDSTNSGVGIGSVDSRLTRLSAAVRRCFGLRGAAVASGTSGGIPKPALAASSAPVAVVSTTLSAAHLADVAVVKQMFEPSQGRASKATNLDELRREVSFVMFAIVDRVSQYMLPRRWWPFPDAVSVEEESCVRGAFNLSRARGGVLALGYLVAMLKSESGALWKKLSALLFKVTSFLQSPEAPARLLRGAASSPLSSCSTTLLLCDASAVWLALVRHVGSTFLSENASAIAVDLVGFELEVSNVLGAGNGGSLPLRSDAAATFAAPSSHVLLSTALQELHQATKDAVFWKPFSLGLRAASSIVAKVFGRPSQLELNGNNVPQPEAAGSSVPLEKLRQAEAELWDAQLSGSLDGILSPSARCRRLFVEALHRFLTERCTVSNMRILLASPYAARVAAALLSCFGDGDDSAAARPIAMATLGYFGALRHLPPISAALVHGGPATTTSSTTTTTTTTTSKGPVTSSRFAGSLMGSYKDPTAFIREILSVHCLNSLNGAATDERGHDRTAFAVQRLLYIAVNRERVAIGAAEISESTPIRPEELQRYAWWSSLPQTTQSALGAFATTKFETIVLFQSERRVPEYAPGMPVGKWLGAWMVGMIVKTAGTIHGKTFEALRNVVKYDVPFASFLLPHVLAVIIVALTPSANVTSSSSSDDAGAKKAAVVGVPRLPDEVRDIQTEILCVLRHASDDANHPHITQHALLLLRALDELQVFRHALMLADRQEKIQAAASSTSAGGFDNPNAKHAAAVRADHIERLQLFFTDIPADLMAAAAAACNCPLRSLKYYEGTQRLPSIALRFDMQQVFAALGDTDSVRAVHNTIVAAAAGGVVRSGAPPLLLGRSPSGGAQGPLSPTSATPTTSAGQRHMQHSSASVSALPTAILQPLYEQQLSAVEWADRLGQSSEMSGDWRLALRHAESAILMHTAADVTGGLRSAEAVAPSALDTFTREQHLRATRCMKHMGQLRLLSQYANGLCRSYPTEPAFHDAVVDAAWRLGEWTNLRDEVDWCGERSNLRAQSEPRIVTGSRSFERGIAVSMSALRGLTLGGGGGAASAITSSPSGDRGGSALTAAAEAIQKLLGQCRLELAMPVLREDFAPAYPSLLTLHALQDISLVSRTIVQCLSDADDQSSRNLMVEELNSALEARLSLVVQSPQVCETILSVHRVAFLLLSRPDLAAERWLRYSDLLRDAGSTEAAMNALVQALPLLERCDREDNVESNPTALGSSSSRTQSARSVLLRSRLIKAQATLMRADGDVRGAVYLAKKGSENPALLGPAQRGELRLLATLWEAELAEQSPAELIARHTEVLAIHPSEHAHHQLARLHDKLFTALRTDSEGKAFPAAGERELVDAIESHVLPMMEHYGSALRGGVATTYLSVPRLLTNWLDSASILHAIAAGSSAVGGGNAAAREKISAKALLCLERVNAKADGLLAAAGASSPLAATHQPPHHPNPITPAIPVAHLVAALPQLNSRLSHPSGETANVLANTLLRLLHGFPQQTLWSLLALTHSTSARAKSDFVKSNILAPFRESGAKERRNVDAAQAMFRCLIDLCNATPAAVEEQKLTTLPFVRRMTHDTATGNLPKDLLMLPLQSCLTVDVTAAAAQLTGGTLLSSSAAVGGASCMATYPTFHAFIDHVDIMPSLQKPKRIGIISTTGATHFFLCKAKDEPRKDMRMMELCSILNILFRQQQWGSNNTASSYPSSSSGGGIASEDVLSHQSMLHPPAAPPRSAGGAKRNLVHSRGAHSGATHEGNVTAAQQDGGGGGGAEGGAETTVSLRRYAVTALTDDCAIIEWVSNVLPLRRICEDVYGIHGLGLRTSAIKALKEKADKGQMTPLVMLRDHVQPRFPPMLHIWFQTQFPDASEWYRARGRYIRSCAAWSMVGHIVGLGDRHGENLLMDTVSGDMLHVDFACMFDKGETLEVPERVRFRLTPNIVSALGVTGTAGPFQKSCEFVLGVQQRQKDLILAHLDTFIHDPLVEWIGKAGKATAAAAAAGVPPSSATFTPRGLISRASRRLNGAVDLYGESREPSSMSLSVEGQVQRLVQHAASLEQRALMYVWWMPWL